MSSPTANVLTAIENVPSLQTSQQDAPRTQSQSRYLLVIFATAIVLTTVVSCVSVSIEHKYLKNYSFFFDAAAYSYLNAVLYTKVQLYGALPAAWQELITNPRNPIRTVPIALFCPSLLAHPFGHLATSIPALAACLFTFGIAVRKRTGSTLFSVSAMLLFCSLNGIYDPRDGFATYWLDFTAALWAGAAAFCLVNSNETRSKRWIIAFGVFASFATLSRYIAAGYLLFSCLPILCVYSFARLRNREKIGSVLLPYLLIFVTIGTLAGSFLLRYCGANLVFYRQCCYSLGQTLQISFTDETHATSLFFTDPMLITLRDLCLVLLFVSRKSLRSWHDVAIPLWLGISTHVLMIFVLRANGGGTQTYYCVPLLFFALVCPFALRLGSTLSYRKLFSLAMILLAIGSFTTAYQKHLYTARRPKRDAIDMKALDVSISKLVSDQNASIVWNEFFDERTWLPTMEAFYRNHMLCMPAGQLYFTVHESGWTSQYPGLSPAQVAEKVKIATNKLVKLAVVFDEPDKVCKANLNNEYSKAVAYEMATEVKKNSQWKRVAGLNSKVFGKLATYVNTRADARAFSYFFKGNVDVHPARFFKQHPPGQ